MTTPDTVTVYGAGAIGGTIGAALAAAGHDVLLVDSYAPHVDTRARHGAGDDVQDP
jgi:2-dehydropantoate 2-reductase